MQSDFDIRQKYMETIDHLEAAKNLMSSVAGELSVEIHVVLENTKDRAAKVAYRIERKEWKNERGDN